jgi:hypothetical protein
MRLLRTLGLLLILSTVASSAQESVDSLKDLARRHEGTAGSKIDAEPPATPLRELTAAAELIVRARLTGMVTRLSDDESTVFRDFTIAVTAIIKQPSELLSKVPGPMRTLTLRQLGGTIVVDGLKLTTRTNWEDPESPMEVGQEYVLFLSKALPSRSTTMTAAAGVYVLTSAHFGAYPIRNGRVGNFSKWLARHTDRNIDDPNAFVAAIHEWGKSTR